MTAKQLIAKLKKFPGNLEVGYAHGDNSEHEVAGWVFSIMLLDKQNVDPKYIYGKEDQSMLDSLPDKCIVLRG
jgi:hypothetical protein